MVLGKQFVIGNQSFFYGIQRPKKVSSHTTRVSAVLFSLCPSILWFSPKTNRVSLAKAKIKQLILRAL